MPNFSTHAFNERSRRIFPRTLFLRPYDNFRYQVESFIEMPERLVDLLFRFLHQNGEPLSQRAREREFKGLTDDEAQRIETIYRDAFELGQG